MFQKNISAGIVILILILTPFAYAAFEDVNWQKVQLTTFFPIAYGEYATLKSTNDSYFATTSGNVGIGMSSGAVVKLDMVQNTAIKVGQAYLSSGGNFAHLAVNEWYNGTQWVVPTAAAGVLLELTGTGAYIFYQPGTGVHTTWATVTSFSGWTAGCSQALKQNIHTLTFADYALLREQFRATDLFSFNRKDLPGEPEVGFIAEHAPDLILDKTKTQVPLIKGIGYLAAIMKAQENVLIPLEKAVQVLTREAEAFRVRQQQIEILQKEVEGLRKKLNILKVKAGKS